MMRTVVLTIRYLTGKMGSWDLRPTRIPALTSPVTGGDFRSHRPIDTVRREHGVAVSQYRGALADMTRLDRELAEHPENRRP